MILGSEWVTIYWGMIPRRFGFCMTGIVPLLARIEVQVDGNIAGVLTGSHNSIEVSGLVIRLHNPGSEPQGISTSVL